jgi:putative two-component system response regulator
VNNKFSLLLVDDEPTNLHILNGIFGEKFQLSFATDGASAIQLAQEVIPDLIILDVMMPDMDGFETCVRLKNISSTRDIPVIFLTALTDAENEAKGLSVGAQDYITKPINAKIAEQRVNTLIEKAQLVKTLDKKNTELLAINHHLDDLVHQRTTDLTATNKKLNEAYLSIIKSLSAVSEIRTPNRAGHSKRVADITQKMAKAMRFDREESNHLLVASLLHDVGFIALPDSITNKPVEFLGSDNFELYKKHVLYGVDCISKIGSDLKLVGDIIATHHENYDGTGYPRGLVAEEIPVSGRILSVAAHFDSLMNGNITGSKMTTAQALKIIDSRRGTQFDDSIVDVLHLVLVGQTLEDHQIYSLRSSQLTAGMILNKDIRSVKGIPLITAGQELTHSSIFKIKAYELEMNIKLLIFVTNPAEKS